VDTRTSIGLPVALDSFVGRKRELRALAAAVEGPSRSSQRTPVGTPVPQHDGSGPCVPAEQG
jgi:hypothetical protein